MTLIATQRFRYLSRTIDIGEEFDSASATDELILLGMGKAKRKEVQEERAKRSYRRRDLTAEN